MWRSRAMWCVLNCKGPPLCSLCRNSSILFCRAGPSEDKNVLSGGDRWPPDLLGSVCFPGIWTRVFPVVLQWTFWLSCLGIASTSRHGCFVVTLPPCNVQPQCSQVQLSESLFRVVVSVHGWELLELCLLYHLVNTCCFLLSHFSYFVSMLCVFVSQFPVCPVFNCAVMYTYSIFLV